MFMCGVEVGVVVHVQQDYAVGVSIVLYDGSVVGPAIVGIKVWDLANRLRVMAAAVLRVDQQIDLDAWIRTCVKHSNATSIALFPLHKSILSSAIGHCYR
jgi:hypothetical protein